MRGWNAARRMPRRYVSRILLGLGGALLAFAGFEYGTMYSAQRNLKHAWQQQQKTAQHTSATAAAEPGLTLLSIPKIGLNAVVVEGVSYRQLAVAPGHMKNTPEPGAPGNSVISAHRDTFFRHIYDLVDGDTVEVARDGKVFTFRVDGKKIVEPTDLAVTRSTRETELTLLTCYPIYYIGPAPKRLVVTARLASVAPEGGVTQVAASH
jgi:sortase A